MSIKAITLVALVLVGSLVGYSFVRDDAQKINTVPSTVDDSNLTNETFSHSVKEHLWKEYSEKYHIFGASSEKRKEVFCQNLDVIEEHNTKNSTYKLGITPFTHLTREEFAALHLGYAAAKKVDNTTDNVTKTNSTPVDIEGSIDWETNGAVTPIKNQGQCGSCWAFSSTGSLEGLNFITNKKLISFSEQELVDCSVSYGNNGCNGGLMDYAFAYVRDNSITTEDAYPYTGTDGNTCQNATTPRVFKNKNFTDVDPNDINALIEAIKQQPVSVAIEADTQAFQLYNSGVLTGDACGTTLDHGVLAVGYGTLGGLGFIKVKNSWGPEWGLQGYVLIGQATGAGVCGINQAPSYPTM